MVQSRNKSSGFLLTNALALSVFAYVATANPTGVSVQSSVPECSDVGTKLLNNGGSSVDAGIATALCDGVLSIQGLAVGGGFVMKIWDDEKKVASLLEAKEQPPAKEKSAGTRAMEVPGNVAGFWEVHQKYGKLPWAQLFEDTVALAEKNGKDPKLVETLKKVRDNGKDIFYQGEIAATLVKEIQAVGGVNTLDDFKNYRPKWESVELKREDLSLKANVDQPPHAFVKGSDGLCLTVTYTANQLSSGVFKSEVTGVILKEV